MKIVMDFRKYDGVIGGVEQGVIQVSKYLMQKKHTVVMLYKKKREEGVKSLFPPSDFLKRIPLNVESHAMSLQNGRLDNGLIQEIASSENAEIIHFFYNWSFPRKSRIPTILTVHDVIPFTFREAMGFYRNKFLYKPGIRLACRWNTHIATVSEFSKKDIMKKVGVPEDKISVIPNGLRDPFQVNAGRQKSLRQKFNLDRPFVLNVGGIHERKNIPRLLRSYAALLKKEKYPGKLVITGAASGPPYQEKMRTLCEGVIAEQNIGEYVVFTGFITEEELDSLFRMADFLIYPSLYEGFGIPILEAMKMGLPVITSNVTAMPEVARDAAFLVDPYSVKAMTQAMGSVWKETSLRKDLVKKGKERARSYTWPSIAESYIKLYKKVINDRPS